jgi:hypothetical protein
MGVAVFNRLFKMLHSAKNRRLSGRLPAWGADFPGASIIKGLSDQVHACKDCWGGAQ